MTNWDEGATHFCNRCKENIPLASWAFLPGRFTHDFWKHPECGWMERIPTKI